MADNNLYSPEDLTKLREYLKKNLAYEIEADPPKPEHYRQTLVSRLEQAYTKTNAQLDDAAREKLFSRVIDDLVGYGPIQPLLLDDEISEIMVNGPDLIFIEKRGELIETDIKFESEDHLRRVIDRMLHPLGLRVDSDHPNADARLPDGSRINIVIPPVAIGGSCISIRKFLSNKKTIEEIVELGTLTPYMADFLQACVEARLNIIISGNTSSGKTTFLNILADFIPEKERIITIEDAAEIQLKQRHVVSLETRPQNVDREGAVSTRDLVRNVLRMRPDRIVVGEVRSGESLDMLQAMNTGHDGSMTTLHANSPRDAISRLETMAMMAGYDIPLKAIRQQIASAINLIVHMTRLQDGTRKTTRITEVAGMEGDVVTLTDIFKFEQSGISSEGKVEGELVATGIRPLFSPRLEIAGFKLGGEIFGAGRTDFGV